MIKFLMLGLCALAGGALAECNITQAKAIAAASFMTSELFQRAAGDDDLLTQDESEILFCGGVGQCDAQLAGVINNSMAAADGSGDGNVTASELQHYFNNVLNNGSDPTLLEYMTEVERLLDSNEDGVLNRTDNVPDMLDMLCDCGSTWICYRDFFIRWWTCAGKAKAHLPVFSCEPNANTFTMQVTAEDIAAVYAIAQPNITVTA